MAENLDIRVTENGAQTVKKNIATIGDEADRVEGRVGLLNKALNGFGGGGFSARAAGIVSSFAGIAGAVAGIAFGAAITGAIKYADSFTGIQNQLKRVSSSSADLAAKTREVFDISQRTRTSFEDNAATYVKLNTSLRAMNMDTAKAGPLLQTISSAIVSSGASADQAKNGIRALGQGFDQGALRGEDFNSVLENTPGLAAAIAVGIGKPVGALRGMAEQGLLTSKVVVDALGRVGPAAANSMANAVPTFSSAVQMMTNAITFYFGQQAQGPVLLLTRAVMYLAENFGSIVPYVLAFGAAIGTVLVLQLVVWFASAVVGLGLLAAAFVTAAARAGIAAAAFALANLPLVGLSILALAAAAAVVALTIGFEGAVKKATEFGTSIKKQAEEFTKTGKAGETLDDIIRKMGGTTQATGDKTATAANKSNDLTKAVNTNKPAFTAAASGADIYGGSLDALIGKMQMTSAEAAGLRQSLAGLGQAAAEAAAAGVQSFGVGSDGVAYRDTPNGTSGFGPGVASQLADPNSVANQVSASSQTSWSNGLGGTGATYQTPDPATGSIHTMPFPDIGWIPPHTNYVNGTQVFGSQALGGSKGGTIAGAGLGGGINSGAYGGAGVWGVPVTKVYTDENGQIYPNGVGGGLIGRPVADFDGTLGHSRSAGNFREGGEFMVGGKGGVDKNLVQFMASRGERVTVSPANDTKEVRRTPKKVEVNFNVRDHDSFRRNKKQVSQDLVRTLSRAG